MMHYISWSKSAQVKNNIVSQQCAHFKGVFEHEQSTVFILIERKQKKIVSNLVCAQLESKQFQEVNFLSLIRCCVVIE